MAEQNPTAQILAQRHHLYEQFAPAWTFYEDSFAGGDQYRTGGYLHKFTKEDEKDYEGRVERAVFTNYIRRQVELVNAFIFKDPIIRTAGDGDFEEFLRDADRRGSSFDQVMSEQVGKLGEVQGHTVVVVDMPRESTVARTRADDRNMGIRPYLTVYTPLDVVDWSMDGLGRYRWLRVQEDAPDEADPFALRLECKKRYRTWTTDEWFLHSEDGVLLATGVHGLGEVPAVFAPVKEHFKYTEIGESLVSDTAPLNRRIFNYESLLDEFLYKQCFNILAVPVDEKMTAEQRKAIASKVGTTKGMTYPAVGSPPSYVSPPVDPARAIMENIAKAERSLIDLAKLQDRRSTSAEKSGIAHKYEFHESNSAFAKIAANMEDAERKIIRLFYQWQKKPGGGDVQVPVTVEYPRDFNLKTVGEEIEEALSALQVNIGPTFEAELKKRIAAGMLPSVDADVWKQIEEEIESAPPRDTVEREFAATTEEAVTT